MFRVIPVTLAFLGGEVRTDVETPTDQQHVWTKTQLGWTETKATIIHFYHLTSNVLGSTENTTCEHRYIIYCSAAFWTFSPALPALPSLRPLALPSRPDFTLCQSRQRGQMEILNKSIKLTQTETEFDLNETIKRWNEHMEMTTSHRALI